MEGNEKTTEGWPSSGKENDVQRDIYKGQKRRLGWNIMYFERTAPFKIHNMGRGEVNCFQGRRGVI